MTAKIAKETFEKMLNPVFSDMTVKGFAKYIRALVEVGQTTWAELGFTDIDVEKRLREAQVRNAKETFEKMLNPVFSDMTVKGIAKDIRALVEAGQTTWAELGFTDSDVEKRLREAQVRNAT